MPLTFSAVLAVLGINAIFAGAYIVGKIGVEHFPPFFFAGMRFVLVALVLAPFLRLDDEVRRNWRAVLAFCLTMGVCVYGTMYWALYLSDGAAAILIGTQFSTPAAVLLGALWLKEKTTRAVWLGIGAAMSGVFIVGFDTVALGYPLGFGLVIISAIFYALANVINRKLRDSQLGLLNLNALMAVVSAPALLLLSLLTGEEWRAPVVSADGRAWFAVLYSALAVSLIGHVGLFRLLRRYSLSAIMPFYVFTPIFGVLGAIIFLGEEPTLRFMLGAAVAVAGIIAVNFAMRRRGA